MKLVAVEEIRDAVGRLLAAECETILRLLPWAEVEEMGATAVPGSLTKGDLDLLVRVPAECFEDAVTALRRRYEVHQLENWSQGFASFRRMPEADVPVGVQLVVSGGEDDRAFIAWREALLADPELLRRYNAVKLAQAEASEDEYRQAKAELIGSVLKRL